jgi:hypothetical protein
MEIFILISTKMVIQIFFSLTLMREKDILKAYTLFLMVRYIHMIRLLLALISMEELKSKQLVEAHHLLVKFQSH